MKRQIKDQILSRIPTGQMRPREIVKLFYQIIKSLYQVSSEHNYAWEGTLSISGNRVWLYNLEDGKMTELDSFLPMGETGKLIWIKDEPDDEKEV